LQAELDALKRPANAGAKPPPNSTLYFLPFWTKPSKENCDVKVKPAHTIDTSPLILFLFEAENCENKF
jgi:hypothetical protein